MFEFECLLQLQDVLDQQLVDMIISIKEYNVLWTEILKASGYTEVDYQRLIDERWFKKVHYKNLLLS